MKIFSFLDDSPVVRDYEVIDFKKWESGFYYKIRVNLMSDDLLFVREYSDEKDRHYSFHWQDNQAQLIVRWDNAPHHPHLKTYPHHKHRQGTIEKSRDITLEEVLNYITKQKKS